MEKSFDLKPCPFCGEIPKIESRKVEERVDCRSKSYTSVGVWCCKCWFGLCSSVVDEKNIEKVLMEKIKHWNTRADI